MTAWISIPKQRRRSSLSPGDPFLVHVLAGSGAPEDGAAATALEAPAALVTAGARAGAGAAGAPGVAVRPAAPAAEPVAAGPSSTLPTPAESE